MSLCPHGFAAFWDRPYCERECLTCGKMTPESDLNHNSLCRSCAKAPNQAVDATFRRILAGL